MYPNARQIAALQAGLADDLLLFLPELVVCAGVVFLLVARLVKFLDRTHLGGLAVATLVVALFTAGYLFADVRSGGGTIFAGMLEVDPFAGLVRVLVLSAALLTVLLTRLTGIPDREDSADFYTLLLGGTLGMMLMGSANHLLMAFIAVEMASLPGYALAGFLKGKKLGSEAALKYVVFGAAASGVMLYGITLISGTFGTGYLPDVAKAIALSGRLDAPVLAGFALVMVGLGFKLAAVPFHFWCPDVFEGAAAEVAGFLSVASKAAAIALTARVVLTIQGSTGTQLIPASLGVGLGVIAAVTVTFGNLAAFGQTNLKRLLAYSTIAHAGYMLLGVAVVTQQATSAVLFYLAAYVLMNQGAFAVVALVRNATGSETIDAFRGLVWRSPVLAVTMALFLFSLLGFPPLAGFAGKFQVFEALYEAGKASTADGRSDLGAVWYALLGVGAVNTAVSAYYYLRIVRAMLLDDPETPAPASAFPSLPAAGFLSVLAALLIALGVVWNPLTAAADRAAASFSKVVRVPGSGVPTR
jgi:NADH-quinone oxidoreductase subunit N